MFTSAGKVCGFPEARGGRMRKCSELWNEEMYFLKKEKKTCWVDAICREEEHVTEKRTRESGRDSVRETEAGIEGK